MSSAILSRPTSRYTLRAVPTPALVRQLDVLAEQELATDADVLAHMAELEVREEYLRAGYASMQDYCVRRLRMSEDRANKRIRACRTALAFPVIFEMIADGRLNLTAVLMLKARLTEQNAEALLADAASLSNDALEMLLARRFPRFESQPDAPSLLLTCGIAGNSEVEVAARPPLVPSGAPNDATSKGPLPGTTEPCVAPAQLALHAKFTPLSAECVALRGQLSMTAYEHFQRVRALASHRVPSGNAALVIEYALKLAAELLDRQKFGKGVRTRPADGQPNGRHVPKAIRQAVCERDGGRCTFTGPDGTRCGSEWHLELDHIVPLAKGGATTANNLRTLCRRHIQLEARREFGAAHIAARTEQARAEAVRARQRNAKRDARGQSSEHPRPMSMQPDQAVASRGQCAPAPADAGSSVCDVAPSTTRDMATADDAHAPAEPNAALDANESVCADIIGDIIAALRTLRFSLAEARRGVEITAHMPGASAEDRVRAALQKLGRAPAHRVLPVQAES